MDCPRLHEFEKYRGGFETRACSSPPAGLSLRFLQLAHWGPEIHISTAFEGTQCGSMTERAVAPAATSARAFWLILSLQAQLEPIRQARD
jgi:hypothetical protein